MGWVVVYITPNQQAARALRELLQREGFMVSVRPTGDPGDGVTVNFEVLVPSSEAKDASDLLIRALAS